MSPTWTMGWTLNFLRLSRIYCPFSYWLTMLFHSTEKISCYLAHSGNPKSNISLIIYIQSQVLCIINRLLPALTALSTSVKAKTFVQHYPCLYPYMQTRFVNWKYLMRTYQLTIPLIHFMKRIVCFCMRINIQMYPQTCVSFETFFRLDSQVTSESSCLTSYLSLYCLFF